MSALAGNFPWALAVVASWMESYIQQRIGHTLGERWRLEGVLGVGGMAAVYRACDSAGNEAAVKVLHPEIGMRPEIRDRFMREGYVANKIQHPGVVQVLEHGAVDDWSVFLVMERLRGESLADRVKRHGGLPLAELLDVLDQVLDVLAVAHQVGVVHRDLKPDNLFVTGEGRVKVLDFGLARVMETTPDDVRTRTGMAMGTMPYMAPEQALGRRSEIDGRVDLFALGATAFRILAKRRIHESESEAAMLVAMATQPAPSLASVAAHVPEGVGLLVDLALAFDRDARYPDARCMQRDVQALKRGEAPPFATARLRASDELTCAGGAVMPSAPGGVGFAAQAMGAPMGTLAGGEAALLAPGPASAALGGPGGAPAPGPGVLASQSLTVVANLNAPTLVEGTNAANAPASQSPTVVARLDAPTVVAATPQPTTPGIGLGIATAALAPVHPKPGQATLPSVGEPTGVAALTTVVSGGAAAAEVSGAVVAASVRDPSQVTGARASSTSARWLLASLIAVAALGGTAWFAWPDSGALGVGAARAESDATPGVEVPTETQRASISVAPERAGRPTSVALKSAGSGQPAPAAPTDADEPRREASADQPAAAQTEKRLAAADSDTAAAQPAQAPVATGQATTQNGAVKPAVQNAAASSTKAANEGTDAKGKKRADKQERGRDKKAAKPERGRKKK